MKNLIDTIGNPTRCLPDEMTQTTTPLRNPYLHVTMHKPTYVYAYITDKPTRLS